MAKRYNPTFEEYEEMGERLKEFNQEMVDIHILISNKIGKSKLDKMCDFWKWGNKVSTLRSELEEMMYKDYPHKANLDVFYGESKKHQLEKHEESK